MNKCTIVLALFASDSLRNIFMVSGSYSTNDETLQVCRSSEDRE